MDKLLQRNFLTAVVRKKQLILKFTPIGSNHVYAFKVKFDSLAKIDNKRRKLSRREFKFAACVERLLKNGVLF